MAMLDTIYWVSKAYVAYSGLWLVLVEPFWRHAVFITWTEWTQQWLCHDNSTINIVHLSQLALLLRATAYML